MGGKKRMVIGIITKMFLIEINDINKIELALKNINKFLFSLVSPKIFIIFGLKSPTAEYSKIIKVI